MPTPTIRDETQTVITLLGPAGGDWPTAAEEVDHLIPTRVSRTIGGSQLNTISLDWALERSNDRLVDAVTPVGYDRVVDVHLYNPDDGTTRRICWGNLGEQSHYLSRGAEGVKTTASLAPWLIAPNKTAGFKVRNAGGAVQLVDGPIVFNPTIDDRVVGNRASVVGTGSSISYWLDPETARTPAARTAAGQTANLWTLPQVIHTLCYLLNPDETYVENPSITTLNGRLAPSGMTDTELIRDLRLDSDLWLSQCLDRVLEPFGMGWCLEFDDSMATSGSDTQHTWFRFFELNTGPQKKVYLQRPGSTAISRDDTNVSDYHANLSIVDLANEVEGFTAPLLVESTFDLHPVWTENLDSQNIDELNTPDERATGTVHRKYVVNESGDINSVRTTPTALTSLDSLLTESHPDDGTRVIPDHRRRLLPALTEGLDRGTLADNLTTERDLVGERGYLLEYQRRWTDTLGAEQTEDWIEPDWRFAVLRDQMGIRLTGAVPFELHTQLQEFPNDVALRITCSVQSDFARHVVATKQTSSPQAKTIRSVLDLSSRFHVRRVDSTSSLYTDRHPAITAVSSGAGGTFEAGSLVVPLQTGDRFAVRGSTGNDGLYTVASYADPTITVVETIPDATADGNLALFTREIDDTRELQEYCEHIRDWDDSAALAVSVTLDGIDHTEYALADLITKVEGRNLDLDKNSSTAATARYLHIVGINYELADQQHMELVLDNTRVERFDFSRDA